MLIGAGGCTFVKRALTWPGLDPLLDEDWYEPCDRVAGDRVEDLPTEDPGRVRIPAHALLRLTAYAEQQNSCALLVLHRGRIVLEKYWCGMKPDSRVNAWSMSKTVVALLVGLALDRGRLKSVDEPIGTWISEWSRDERGRITIRQLLQMTSGLRIVNMIRIHIGTSALAAVLDTPLVARPGAEFRYNNVNTLVLSLILQRATGQRYADYLSSSLWKPMGASDAAVWLDDEGGIAKTYCCLLTTARGWARVGLLLQNRGRVGDRRVVPAAWIDEMLRPSPLEENYGYHVWLGYSRPVRRLRDWSSPFATADTFMLIGRDEQRVYVVPSHELVIVRLGHQGDGWDDPVMPNIVVEALRTSVPSS